MNKINFTTHPRKVGDKFHDTEILVDSKISINQYSRHEFRHCIFIFEINGSIEFDDCDVQECEFKGLTNSSISNRATILITKCKNFNHNSFSDHFWLINIDGCHIQDFNDQSAAIHYNIIRTTIKNFTINGECNNLKLEIARFYSLNKTKSVWEKKIASSATCNSAIFDNVRLNPFYLATKCRDKTSLDISRATLIDNWSQLRKKYSGLSLFIVFFLTFLFFLPLLTHSFFLIALSKIGSYKISSETIPLWEAILFGGKSGWAAILYALLTTILLIYNAGRIYMTISISRLKEEEIFMKDSNFNLISIHPEKYRVQLIMHKILSVLFWISVGYTALKLIDTLKISVPAFNY